MKIYHLKNIFLFILPFNLYSQSLDPCVLLQNEGYLQEAIDCNINVISNGGNENGAYYNIATIYFNQEQYDQAFNAANKAVEADSLKSNGYSIRGYILYKSGYVKEGLMDLLLALVMDPKDQGALVGVVQAMEELYEFEKIDTQLNYCNQAIELNPEFSYLYRRRGLLKYIGGKKIDGCLDLTKAAELGDSSSKNIIREFCLSDKLYKN